MCITNVDDCNNIILNDFTIKDIVSVSRVNIRSYRNIKCNILYKQTTQLKSKRKISKQLVKKGLLSLLVHINGKMKVGNITHHALKYGQIPILKWYVSTLPKPLKCNAALSAIASEHGQVVSLDWLYENTSFKFNKNSIINAITNKHLNVIEWFHAHGFILKGNYVQLLNNKDMLIWFIDHDLFELSHENITNVLSRNDTAIMDVLYERGFRGFIGVQYERVIRLYMRSELIRHVTCIECSIWLKWTKDHNFIYDEDDIIFWLKHQFFNIVKILVDNDMLIPNYKDVMKMYVLGNPTFKLIKWAKEHDIIFNDDENLGMYWVMIKPTQLLDNLCGIGILIGSIILFYVITNYEGDK